MVPLTILLVWPLYYLKGSLDSFPKTQEYNLEGPRYKALDWGVGGGRVYTG